MFARLLALLLLILLSPLFLFLLVLVKFSSRGPFIFRQLRAGRNRRPFWIYKIRTMVVDAESLKSKIRNLNEADGPVFKIRHDPRFTAVGKYISFLALDELPQLVNIIKGEMAFVGPRPLPVDEASKVPAKYSGRFSALPGMTSPWVVQGAHRLTFSQWMESDLDYVRRRSFWYDVGVLAKTVILVAGLVVRVGKRK